jgi:hypothetical protein
MSPLTQPPLAANRSERRESAAPAGGISGLLWLTWRQHRWALLGSLLMAAVLVGWMAYLAADMTTLHHQCHDTLCPPNSPQQGTLSARYGPVAVSSYLLLLVRYMPLLIGVFIGVPMLAREHEQRTLVLAWSQDVSPVRWLCTKLALLGLFVAAVTAAVSAVSDHLEHVLTTVSVGSLFEYTAFLNTGMLPLAISLSWFAVGVALGAAIRRTLPAVFGVIAGFVALMLVVQWRYPTLLKPVSFFRHFDQPDAGPGPGGANALAINRGPMIGRAGGQNLFDSSGHELDLAALRRMCPDIMDQPDAARPCFVGNHLQTHIVYQPGSRIPEFHLILASGYLGLGAVALVAVWLIVRRTNLSVG